MYLCVYSSTVVLLKRRLRAVLDYVAGWEGGGTAIYEAGQIQAKISLSIVMVLSFCMGLIGSAWGGAVVPQAKPGYMCGMAIYEHSFGYGACKEAQAHMQQPPRAQPSVCGRVEGVETINSSGRTDSPLLAPIPPLLAPRPQNRLHSRLNLLQARPPLPHGLSPVRRRPHDIATQTGLLLFHQVSEVEVRENSYQRRVLRHGRMALFSFRGLKL